MDEIKILFNISHPNIVRIYNYYLYPSVQTGFLQMEYVDGVTIDKFEVYPWSKKDWNDIFVDVISAFEYLEKNQILHRDIRPANIMIDKDDTVKIIDFGFGKQIVGYDTDENSILLNWPATEMPDEVQLNQEYDERTEIYFIGTLFRHLLSDKVASFKFTHIIEKMTKINPSLRYQSFSEIINDISVGVISEIKFSENEKNAYRKFADQLVNHISHYTDKYSPINSIPTTLSKLSDVIRSSALEEYIQDNSKIIDCFISGNYTYSTITDIEVQAAIDFYSLITSLSPVRQKILFDNIYMRLAAIRVKAVKDDDLPF